MNFKHKLITIIGIALLITPLITSAGATYQNPIPGTTINILIKNVLIFLAGLTGILGLLGIVYGGTMIIVGGMKSEEDLRKGKQIIFWAIAGLMISGMGALILFRVGRTLGF